MSRHKMETIKMKRLFINAIGYSDFIGLNVKFFLIKNQFSSNQEQSSTSGKAQAY